MKSRYTGTQRAMIATGSFIENLIVGLFIALAIAWLFAGLVCGMMDAGPNPTMPGTSYAARIVQWSPTYQAFVHGAPYVAAFFDWLTRPRP